MADIDYIENLWAGQPYKKMLDYNPLFQKGNFSNCDFQDLFWIFTSTFKVAKLSSCHDLYIPIKEIAHLLGLSIKNTRQLIRYLDENGYLEIVRLFLKNQTYIKKLCKKTLSPVLLTHSFNQLATEDTPC